MKNTAVLRMLSDLYHMGQRTSAMIGRTERGSGIVQVVEGIFDKVKGLDEEVIEYCRGQENRYEEIKTNIDTRSSEISALESEIAYHAQFDNLEHKLEQRKLRREQGRLKAEIAVYESHQAKLVRDLEKDHRMMENIRGENYVEINRG